MYKLPFQLKFKKYIFKVIIELQSWKIYNGVVNSYSINGDSLILIANFEERFLNITLCLYTKFFILWPLCTLILQLFSWNLGGVV